MQVGASPGWSGCPPLHSCACVCVRVLQSVQENKQNQIQFSYLVSKFNFLINCTQVMVRG